ncbi:MAG: hypothetical protein LV477_00940 [Candidatus Nitrosotalea sp.]|nr:hypothetical protein [Candidatus Nitrosotalea sp.]
MTNTGKSLGNKTISTKIPREEFTRFQYYCAQNGETINASLRRMILSEIDNPHPSKIAGNSMFQYNKNKDNFSWRIALDDETTFSIDDDLPANSIEHLLESLMKAKNERNSFIKKTNIDSVSLPNKLLRRRK